MKGVRLSLRLLMHTKIGIEKTLGFLKQTRLCSKKWHLEREQEVGEVRELREEV
jgi:hypothetical protein